MRYHNTEIYYETLGQGNPIVLLHGFLESSSIWKPFVTDLSKTRMVIIIDLPGHGKSGNISEVHSMELMGDVVIKVLEGLNIEKISLVGHSMGGYVSLALLEKYEKRINSILLMNSTPEEDSEEKKNNRERAAELVKKNKEAYISMAISNLLTADNNKKFETEINELKMEAFTLSEEGIVAALLGMKIRTNKILPLKTFGKSKVIVAGRQDPVLEYTKIENLSKTCRCELRTNNGGHLSLFENKSEIQNIMHLIE